MEDVCAGRKPECEVHNASHQTKEKILGIGTVTGRLPSAERKGFILLLCTSHSGWCSEPWKSTEVESGVNLERNRRDWGLMMSFSFEVQEVSVS